MALRDSILRARVLSGEINKPDFMNFTAVQAGSTITYTPSSVTSMEYSFDKQTWNSLNNQTITLANAGDKVYLRGNISNNQNTTGYAYFTTTGLMDLAGCLMSIYNKQLDGSVISKIRRFTHLFANNTAIRHAKNLIISPKLANGSSTFEYMFSGCSNLLTVPKLEATSHGDNNCRYMFQNCTSLQKAPELPATTLGASACAYIFRGCSAITSTPDLPSATIGTSAYEGAFYGCTSLTKAPKLPTITLAQGCYSNMFLNCKSLTEAPELPATILKHSCYQQMFYGCTNLTKAPDLPALSLVYRCYSNMFNGCTSLTKGPNIAATGGAIEDAPLWGLFDGCTNIHEIKIRLTSWTDQSFWVRNVPATGDFYNLGGATMSRGNGAIPTGWTIHTEE